MSANQIHDEIRKAIGAHGAWKMRLRTAIAVGSSEVAPAQVRCDDKCAFGLWLHGPSIDAETRSGMPFQVVKRLHAEFHRCAGDVMELAVSGDRKAAEALMNSEYARRSDKLIAALNKWRNELPH